MKKNKRFKILRPVTLLAILAGAGVSVGFTIYSGRNNNSLVLQVLFAGWVIMPFIGMFLALLVSRRWPDSFCLTLYTLIILIIAASLICYSGLFRLTKPGFIFLIVPLISWILLAVVIPVAHARSNNRSPQKGIADFFRGVK
jgi:hypothetical protein